MLASCARLRAPEDFRATVRQGVRVARPSVVVHLREVPNPRKVHIPLAVTGSDREPTRVGFVVSKAVGGAVVRNRVKRRLRHLTRPLVEAHPTGRHAVVRALPAAAGTSDLARDLDSAWRQAESRLQARP